MQSPAGSGERDLEEERSIARRKALGTVRAVKGRIVTWLNPFLLCFKGGAAATGPGGVGIDDLEAGVREVVGVIYVAASEVLQTVCGQENPYPILFDHLITLCLGSDLHGILQASAPSALDPESQAGFLGSPFLDEERLQFLDRIGGKRNHSE